MKWDNDLKYIYKKFYNDGKFVELIIKTKNIKKLNKYYKNNFENYNNFNDFFTEMKELKEILLISKAAYCEFKKQFENQKGLQPAIITECFISQTIASTFQLKNFIDADEKEENIPKDLLWKIMTFKGILENSIPRYIYYNNKSSIILLQYGDSSSIDAIIINNKTNARIEFKEQKSKLNEIDISGLYTEDGILTIDNSFKEQYKDYIKYIKIFNKETNMFQQSGHNFKISKYLKERDLKNIFQKFLDNKNIDLFILQQKNYIYPILSKDLINNIDISGSEIRPAGKNYLKVFTPKYAEAIINSLNGNIDKNQMVTLPFNKKNITIGRNKSTPTRYKINSLLFVKFKDIEYTDTTSNFIYFYFKNIKQLKPTISLHLDAKINKTILKNRYLELNS